MNKINNTPLLFKRLPQYHHKLPSKNLTLGLVNINGVYYKSTKTKLQKQESTVRFAQTPAHTVDQSKSRRMLIVRGEKFFLDAGGKKLKRVVDTLANTSLSMTRIDIGGLTYLAKSNNTYEQTDFHKTRVHLAVAKQRSIQTLSRNLVKINVNCVIFQKLGKCRALDRGRCTKLHDPKRVAICHKLISFLYLPIEILFLIINYFRFLTGNCTVEKCLLSHNVNLSKMPTCKFYLLGMCSKSDCLYLHKKVNEKTEICVDFLKGFCEQAEKVIYI